MRGHLRRKIAGTFHRRPHVAIDEVQHRLIHLAGGDQLYGRDDEPFLEELRREGHGAGGHTADVCLVGAAGEIADQLSRRLLALEDRRNHSDVRQVGAAQIGIVEDN